MGASLSTEWMVLCGGVELRTVTEGAADGRSTLMLERILDPPRAFVCQPMQPDTGAKIEVIVAPVSLRVSLCNQTLEPAGARCTICVSLPFQSLELRRRMLPVRSEFRMRLF